MINDKIRDAFNEQIKHEAESAYLYFGMSAWFQNKSFDGMAQWMRAQAVEEMGHAQRFMNHILDREGKVSLLPLGIEKTEWKSPLEAFQDALAHEKFITGKINDLVPGARVAIAHGQMPGKTLEEIMESEIRYMDAFDKHPFLTDIKYFFKAVFNIIFRRYRSR